MHKRINNEESKEKKKTLFEIDKSAFWRLDAREVRLVWSTEQGPLLCSVIFPTPIPSSP